MPLYKKASFWRNVAFFVGVVAIIYMISTLGVKEVVSNILQVRWYFLLLLVLWGGIYVINALSWYVILCRDAGLPSVSFARIYKLTVSGYALNYITPFGLAGGEPYRVMELQRDLPSDQATSSVILYAMMHVCSHLFFWLSAILVFVWTYPQSPVLIGVITAIVVVCIFLITLFFKGYKQGLVVAITQVIRKIPFLGKKITLKQETQQKLIAIDLEIKRLKGTRTVAFYISLFLEYVARIVSCLEIYIILTLLSLPITFIGAFVIVALSSLLANLLFFFPMQLGAREGGLYVSLEMLGFNPGLSVALSMITRLREMFWIIIGVMLMKIHRSSKSIQYDK